MSSTGATEYRDGGAYYTPPHVSNAIVARHAAMFRAYPAAGRHRGRRLRSLDPCSGGGAFPMSLMWHDLVRPGSLEVMDLDPGARALRLPGGMLRTVATVTGDPVQTGFLVTDPQQVPDLVATNPPFGVPRPPEPCSYCDGRKRVRVKASHRSLRARGRKVGSLVKCPRCKGAGLVEFTKAIPVAQEHIERCLEVSDRWVLLLMRLAMLEAGERESMWARAPLSHVDVLRARPEFSKICTACAGTGLGERPGAWIPPPCTTCDGTGNAGKPGSDSAAYGAFLFDHQHSGPPALGWL